MSVQCRTCGNVIYNENPKNLFKRECSDILLNVEMLAGNRIENFPGLPSHICGCCLLDVKRAYFYIMTFRERFLKTQGELFNLPALKSSSSQRDFNEMPSNIYKKAHIRFIPVDMLDDLMESHESNDNCIDLENVRADHVNHNLELPMKTDKSTSNSSYSFVNSSQETIYQPIKNYLNVASDREIKLTDWDELEDETLTHIQRNTTSIRNMYNIEDKGSSINSTKVKIKKKCYMSWKTLTEEEVIERKRQQRRRDCMCDQCGRHFTDRSNFKLHMLRHSGIKNFECKECSKKFYTDHLLQLHDRVVHQGERPYACKYCSKSFHNSTTRLIHERYHANVRPYSCENCKKSFISASSLKRHMLIHNGLREYYCEVCDKDFQRKTHLEAHLRSKGHSIRQANQQAILFENISGFPIYLCKDCQLMIKKLNTFRKRCVRIEAFLNRRKLKWRKNSTSADTHQLFIDPLCIDKQAHTKLIGIKKEPIYEHDRHFSEEQDVGVDKKSLNYQANCHKMSRSSLEKELGVLPVNAEKREIKLDTTKASTKSTSQKYTMRVGKRIMYIKLTDEQHPKRIVDRERQWASARPCICEYCGRQFKDGSNLNVHLLRHTGTKKYVCLVCNEKCYTLHLLRRHKLKHTEGPYECNFCGLQYSTNSSRVRHEREACKKGRAPESKTDVIKRGERTFHCNICDLWFLRAGNLTQHLNSSNHIANERRKSRKIQMKQMCT